MVEHEIIRDHTTKRSRGFGFVVFDSEQVVDNILVDTNKIDMGGTKVHYIYFEVKTIFVVIITLMIIALYKIYSPFEF